MNSYQEYSDLFYDSRKVTPGSIFVAITGGKHDGHDFIEDVIKAGARLVVVQEDIVKQNSKLKTLIDDDKNKFLVVADTRQQLALIADQFYGQPSKRIKVLGVTGTNGKTTVTHLLQSIFESKFRCGLLGTMGLKETVAAAYEDQGNTTPFVKEVQKILAYLVTKKYDYLTMEVSSHALDQKRVAEIHYKHGVVTNLTQDHLDYHKTMNNYFKAKALLFKQVTDSVVLNCDDSYYDSFAYEAKQHQLKIVTVSTKDSSADLFASNIEFGADGLSYTLKWNNELITIKLRLNSMFNVYNSLSAIAVALQEGFSLKEIQQALAQAPVVAGRFEVIKEAHSPYCIVDYAHTPDGLLNVLQGAKAMLKGDGKLICLFGCGGDRDITKRPIMGQIADQLADLVYVTSDNPRTEDPEQIVADILTGIKNMSKTKVVVDRRQAILEAIRSAKPADIVVIAGKGHEDYQILGTTKIHFDDREEVRKALSCSLM